MSENSTRYLWIDICKAFLIFTMVMGHAGATGWERDWFYAFHMPAFFIISGFLYKPRPVHRTARGFFFPVLVFGLLTIVYGFGREYLKTGEVHPINYLMHSWQPLLFNNDGTYHTPFTGVWFIMVLFFCRCLLGDVRVFSLLRNHAATTGAVCLVASLVLQYVPAFIDLSVWHVAKVVYCMPFLCAGLLLKRYADVLLRLRTSLLVGLALTYVVLTYLNSPTDLYERFFGRDLALVYLNAGVASLLLFNVTGRIRIASPKALHIVRLWSAGTMVILGIHGIIIDMYKVLGYRHYIQDFHLSYLVLACLVMLLVLPLTSYLLKHFPAVCGK